MADISTVPPLTRASVIAAHELIKPHVHYTPVLTNATLTELASTPRTLDQLCGTRYEYTKEGAADGESSREKRQPARPKMRLWFKCENLQRIGAFKVRGAFHAVKRLMMEPGWEEAGGREKGVVTHSSGNHAQALALAARDHGIPAHIVMPTISSPPKIAATRGYGANIVFSGSTSVERETVAAKVIAETGARLVPPYDHPDIMLGQGTMGLELLEQVERMKRADLQEGHTGLRMKCSYQPTSTAADTQASRDNDGRSASASLDAIVAPCGGGGMLSGIALSCQGTGTLVFGAEPSFQGADDAKRGFESGARVTNVSTLTIADGLRTPLGAWPWNVIYEQKLVRGMYSVTEEEIKAAMRLVFERFKMVVEPSACVPLAVALFDEDFRLLVEREGGERGWDVGIVFSGGNVGVDMVGKLFSEELKA